MLLAQAAREPVSPAGELGRSLIAQVYPCDSVPGAVVGALWRRLRLR